MGDRRRSSGTELFPAHENVWLYLIPPGIIWLDPDKASVSSDSRAQTTQHYEEKSLTGGPRVPQWCT